MTTDREALVKRLQECQRRIGDMCKESRPPKMCIPHSCLTTIFLSATQTDWRWKTATALRECQDWQTREISLAAAKEGKK